MSPSGWLRLAVSMARGRSGKSTTSTYHRSYQRLGERRSASTTMHERDLNFFCQVFVCTTEGVLCVLFLVFSPTYRHAHQLIQSVSGEISCLNGNPTLPSLSDQTESSLFSFASCLHCHVKELGFVLMLAFIPYFFLLPFLSILYPHGFSASPLPPSTIIRYARSTTVEDQHSFLILLLAAHLSTVTFDNHRSGPSQTTQQLPLTSIIITKNTKKNGGIKNLGLSTCHLCMGLYNYHTIDTRS